jgi:tight adherence protein C
MSDFAFIIAGISSIACFVLYMLVDMMTSKKSRLKKMEFDNRLTKAYNDLGLDRNEEQFSQLDLELSGFARIEEQILRVIGVDVDKSLKEYRQKTIVAGFDGNNSSIHLLFFKRVAGYIVSVLGALLIWKGGLQNISIGLLLLIIGLFGANLFLNNARQKRQKLLLRSFPDGLDLMVVCVESGLALDAAVNRVADELGSAHPIFAKELNKTRLELALLNNRSQALMNMADRTDLVAYRSLAAALIQTEKFGTNLSDTLRVLSDDYRQTRLMYAEEKAGRLPALMTIPLILLLMPAFMLIVLGPMWVRIKAQGGIMGK